MRRCVLYRAIIAPLAPEVAHELVLGKHDAPERRQDLLCIASRIRRPPVRRPAATAAIAGKLGHERAPCYWGGAPAFPILGRGLPPSRQPLPNPFRAHCRHLRKPANTVRVFGSLRLHHAQHSDLGRGLSQLDHRLEPLWPGRRKYSLDTGRCPGAQLAIEGRGRGQVTASASASSR